MFQAAMETVHGPKLTSLVGELLQPLDLGKEKYFEWMCIFVEQLNLH